MARCVAQFTAPSLCPRRHVRPEEYRKPRHSVKMMSSSQVPVLRIQSFSGLRPINALDLTARPDQDFLSMVNLSISSRKGRASRCVTKAVFERFTEEPIKVIVMAQEEARRLGHNLVGTEQILLGLIKEGTGITAKVFKSMGINLKDTRGEVEKIIGRGTGTVPVEIPFTRSGTHVVKLSLMEARQRGHKNVLSEHLLLSLLREGGGEAARVLENLGADPSNIRREVIRMIEEFQ